MNELNRAANYDVNAARLDQAEILYAQKNFDQAADVYLYFFHAGGVHRLGDPVPKKPTSKDYLCELEPSRIGEPKNCCVHGFIATMKAFENGKTTSTLAWSQDNRIDALFEGMGNGFLTKAQHLKPLLAELKKYQEVYLAKGELRKAAWCINFANYWVSKLPESKELSRSYAACLAELDQRICHGIRKAMEADKRISARSQDISVTCTGGKVTLAGFADDRDTILTINHIASDFPGVVTLQNDLRYRESDGRDFPSGIHNSHPNVAANQVPRFPDL